MNIFKLFLPKENVQIVSELESWTVTWYVYTGWSQQTKRQAKVFIKEDEAKEFKRQLEEQAKFIGCYIETSINRN